MKLTMPPQADRTCSQCSRPLTSESHSHLCSLCRTALFSLAIDDTLEDYDEPIESSSFTGFDAWTRLQSVLPDRKFVREIGRGGMGSVSQLRHQSLERSEALKVLLPELADNPRFVERFLRESKVLARLQHLNIVTIYDYSESDGILYILMDYIDGGTLRQAIVQGSLDLSQRFEIISQLARGLAYAHQQGIIHRDVNPNNVLLTQSGDVKIVDFGLCTHSDQAPSEVSVTRPHEVMGTYGYLAPEQHAGSHTGNARSDVYALGVICYELFTQRLPQGVFRPPSADSAVSPEVDDIILKALKQDPEARFANAQEFLAAWESAPHEASAVSSPRSETASSNRSFLMRLAFAITLIALAIFTFRDQLFPKTTTALPSTQGSTTVTEAGLPKEFIIPGLDMPLKWVPPGEFTLGALNAEDSDSSPPLAVQLTYGFWMGIYEVTQLQYVNVAGNNPSHFGPARANSDGGVTPAWDWRQLPVDSVTWREASAFCEKLTRESRRNGFIPDNYRFRLPTEIEWEYVSRAGDRSVSRAHFAEATFLEQSWTYEDSQGDDHPQEIGKMPPNAWGFYNLLGNISEHCLNTWWYYPDFEDQTIIDWVDLKEESDRIYRGGSFAQRADRANPFKRSSNAVDERDLAQGFRIVLSEELPFLQEMLNSELPNWFEVDSLGLRMSWIPPGQFSMGESSAETPRGASVSPATQTEITQGFWMGIHEVTEFQWARAMEGDLSWLLGENSAAHDGNSDLPVANVSWYEATDFCHKLTLALQSANRLRDGYVIRLPTEAEWEWACRRDHESLFPFGDDPNELGIQFSNRARYQANGNGTVGPVGENTAGESGLRGLYGNVREWCLDERHDYSGNPQRDPIGQLTPGAREERSLRGGDFLSTAEQCTGTARTFAAPDFKSPRIGFRIILAQPIQPQDDTTQQ